MIVCMGELLIDFVALERDTNVGHAETFHKAPGGAPANVAVGCAKLDAPSAFITQLGNDPFGHYLKATLKENNVDTSGVTITDDANTMLAFVAVEANGERDFAFYRNPSADMLMKVDDLNIELIKQADIFHFGSITLINDPMAKTTLAAVKMARENGATVTYDPNLREVLWPSADAARDGMMRGLFEAHVAKMNEGELAFLLEEIALGGTEDMVDAARDLWHDRLKLLIITLGDGGCIAVTPTRHWALPAFDINVEDLIGAGDGFMAGILTTLYETGSVESILDDDSMQDMLRRANAVGAITATRLGGIPALPSLEEVEAFLS
jgi:fructokinase